MSSSSSLTKEDLANLSLLARISVTQEEEEKMLADMQAILGYVSEINNVSGDAERVKGSHYNIVREDVITHTPGENTESILEEAPDTEDSYVKVAQVMK
jgi:aspartyl-tRNA(Asn)/glutamyl-tRNA(Gln) amidotransferase subunit C